ncbi:MAG: BON domain-containing protein [Clostridia bacterium]|nr:BON domain-containing protein [Clostridia bacterium]
MEKTEDSRLQEEITLMLQERMYLSSDDINVEVRGGNVELSGMVDVLAEKHFAEKLIRQNPKVGHIDNSLTVAMDNPVDDKEITAEVEAKLQQYRVDLGHVGVKTKGGVVRLVGRMASLAEEEAAVAAAESVYGVRAVVSELEVGEANYQDDATITNLIEDAFVRSGRIKAGDIFTRTKGGVVTLLGWVDNPEVAEYAHKLAAQVEGVKGVRNKLNVRRPAHDADVAAAQTLRGILGSRGLSDIKVFVVDEIAYLTGWVASPDQRQEAEDLIHQAKVVKGVSNGIVVTLQ